MRLRSRGDPELGRLAAEGLKGGVCLLQNHG
jgi:hypothetical protein